MIYIYIYYITYILHYIYILHHIIYIYITSYMYCLHNIYIYSLPIDNLFIFIMNIILVMSTHIYNIYIYTQVRKNIPSGPEVHHKSPVC